LRIRTPDPGSGSRIPDLGSRIRISGPDPGFDDLKLKKTFSWKFNFCFLDQNWQFTYPYASIKVKEKPSALKRQHPVLKNMKTLDFFLFLWVIFALLDPDPQFKFGSGSSNSN
jgi:hypothetical protein